MQTKASSPQPEAAPYHLTDASFNHPDAVARYGGSPERETDYGTSHMPEDITRALAQRMHYAAHRMEQAKSTSSREKWHQRYLALRNRIVVGNHKLIFRAVRRWTPSSSYADDMIGDCRVVLIQVVAAYNPWLGVRFSTYAFTCLMRALSRLSHRYSTDLLFRSLPLGKLPEDTLDPTGSRTLFDRHLQGIDEYLSGSDELLTSREKLVLVRRFRLDEQAKAGTLQEVGKELGLSKERVRQVQASALGKLRKALLERTPTQGPFGMETSFPTGLPEPHPRQQAMANANFAGVGKE